MALTASERKEIMRLLGVLQGHLETVIDSNLVVGTRSPARGCKTIVTAARKEWKAAERWVKRLDKNSSFTPTGGTCLTK